MPRRIHLLVWLTVTAALAAVGALLHVGSTPTGDELVGMGLFVSLGGAAQALSYRALKRFSGNISFIPYIAALLISPTWATCTAIAVATLLAESSQKKPLVKRVFNAAQYTLSGAAAAGLYTSLSGVPLTLSDEFLALPISGSVSVFLAVNSFSVALAVGLSEKRNPFSVWRENTRSTLIQDALAIPVVYCAAVSFTHFGLPGFAVSSIVLLGARQYAKGIRDLESTNQELLEVMVAAIEAQDPYTSGHSMRVRRFSEIIAHAIGLPRKKVERIAIAALLHDVGKIDHIFFEILRKPGKLTDEERAIMELHPIKSAELVSRVTQLADIVPSVRHHHENWDGTGYPDRLAGEDIPLASRIIMFADTIDAMTTDRPYRKALSPEQVKGELIRCRGSQFDPNICDALIRSPDYEKLFSNSTTGPVFSVSGLFERVRPSGRDLSAERKAGAA